MTKLRGVAAALTTFTIWGVSPLYWRELGHVPELQVLMHRILWSFVLCATLTVAFARDWSVLATAFGHAKTTAAFRRHGIAALFISGNWAVYVWAVNAGFVSQAGLGDYILPLITVLLGVVFLRERLHRYQWAAIGLATLGLCVISVGYGVFPWVSLVLALCEALYSFAKTSPLVRLNAIQGVAFEMSMLVVPAVAYLVFVEVSEGNRGVFGHGEIHTDLLLVGSGVVTALPLVTLSYAVQHLPLTVVGVLVYVTPTIVVLLAAFAFHEHFSAVILLGFGLVWASLVIFSAQSYMGYRDIHKQDQTADPAIVLTPANDVGLSNSPNLQQSHHIPVDNYHALHSSKAKSPTLLHVA
ncbi:protein RarD [Aphanomyces astaci]|uniref:Protein RarD n=1 Tax=Aphanomyces astaci TaxID=112090 RepID=W4FKG9_APHAT|nr:protein RarD [Aphanomyces astaci]ETV67334.1 protein RarD [Aphanomyces astaci]|eukprot:XP_009843149.1 protein RarD [Aphanomyces astaci]